MNLTGTIAFAAGTILIYAALKNQDPRDVVRQAFGQKPVHGTSGAVWNKSTPVGAAASAGASAPFFIPPIGGILPS